MLRERFSRPLDRAAAALSASTAEDLALLPYDVWGSLAHARMLGETGIVPRRSARRIEAGLRTIGRRVERGRFPLDPSLEDVHLNVEEALTRAIGPDGGRLPTGRSRNDQVAVDLALYLRENLLALELGSADVARALLTKARSAEGERVVAAWTHLQPAQRVYWAHLLGSQALRFVRDSERFQNIRSRLTESPLGSGAIAGSSLPLDRALTAKLLGFERPSASSIDGVSDRDAAVETLGALAILATHASALAEELVIGSMPEVDRVRLDDAFVTTSSLMPHKRNPDTAELVRAAAGPAVGRLVAHLTILKGLPIGYQRDLQTAKPLLFDGVRDGRALLSALAPMVATTEFRAPPARGFTGSVELADALVATGVPFRTAHARVAKFAAARGEEAGPPTPDELRRGFPELVSTQRGPSGVESEPESRVTVGGSGRRAVDRMLATAATRVDRIERTARRERKRLEGLRAALGAPAV